MSEVVDVDALFEAIDETVLAKQGAIAKARRELRLANESLSRRAQEVHTAELLLHQARLRVIKAEDGLREAEARMDG